MMLQKRNGNTRIKMMRVFFIYKISRFLDLVQMYQFESREIHTFIEYSKCYCKAKNTMLYLS